MKEIFKLTPVSIYDIQGVESWLQDMALRGLHLVRFRPLFSTFQEGPAKRVRYRVEPYQPRLNGDAPAPLLELYRDSGWALADEAYQNRVLIFRSEDPNLPEPHTDPLLHAHALERWYRKEVRKFILRIALFLVWVFLMAALLIISTTPLLLMVTSSLPIAGLLALFWMLSFPAHWANLRELSRAIRRLEQGQELDRRSAYPRRSLFSLVDFSVSLLLLILLFADSWIIPQVGGHRRPLTELDAFPLLSLAQVEGEDYQYEEHFIPEVDFRRDPGTGEVEVQVSYSDYKNFCRAHHTLTCWNQWEVVQSGSDSEEGMTRMEIWWFDLPAPLAFLSVPVARELLHVSMALEEEVWWTSGGAPVSWTVETPQTGSGWLEMAKSGDGYFQTAAVALGDKAALVQYTGQGELEAHLEEIMNMVR